MDGRYNNVGTTSERMRCGGNTVGRVAGGDTKQESSTTSN